MKTRTFNSMELKNQIQAKLYNENKNLTDAQQMDKRMNWIMSSDEPLALWYRKAIDNQKLIDNSKASSNISLITR